ncbi:MAG: hypothetical protein ACREIA_01580, partial [Opitutaceae bacterium]
SGCSPPGIAAAQLPPAADDFLSAVGFRLSLTEFMDLIAHECGDLSPPWASPAVESGDKSSRSKGRRKIGLSVQ